jgi:MFS family permease
MRAHGWYLVLSGYWFASSFKWSLILLLLLPSRVASLSSEPDYAPRLALLFGIGAVMALLGPAFFGYLSDRTARRMPWIVAGSLLTAVALVWMAFAPSFWQLVLAYILLQLSDDMAAGAYSALIPDRVPRAQHGWASGWLGVLQVLGSMFALVLGVLFPESALFVLIALLSVLAGQGILRLVGETPGLKSIDRSLWDSFTVVSPWRSADFRWVWVTRFLVMLAYYGLLAYLSQNLSGTDAWTTWALIGIALSMGSLVLPLFGGYLSDQKGRKNLITVAGLGLALSTLALSFIYSMPWILPVLIVVGILGVFFGLYLAVDWALISDILPDPSSHATDMGIWQVSSIFPQLIAGSLVTWAAEGTPGVRMAFFICLAVCFFLGGILVRQVRGVR